MCVVRDPRCFSVRIGCENHGLSTCIGFKIHRLSACIDCKDRRFSPCTGLKNRGLSTWIICEDFGLPMWAICEDRGLLGCIGFEDCWLSSSTIIAGLRCENPELSLFVRCEDRSVSTGLVYVQRDSHCARVVSTVGMHVGAAVVIAR